MSVGGDGSGVDVDVDRIGVGFNEVPFLAVDSYAA